MSTTASSRSTAPSGATAQQLPPGFDGLQYIASHGDLIEVLGVDEAAGEQHYLAFGEDENRTDDSFNAAGYLDRYPDLEAVFDDDTDAATEHYIRFGFDEGRTDPPALPPGFDGLQYIASHDDLIETLGPDRFAGEQHYLAFGDDESRADDTFNEEQYLANNPDLQAAFGDNGDRATEHYIRFGFDEDRTDNTPPTAVADAGAATEDGDPVTVDVLANDTDPDPGDSLTVASVDATADTTGDATLEDGEVTYDLGDNGQELAEGETTTDSFAYTVRDETGAESTAAVTITITGVNDTPSFTSDATVSIAENTADPFLTLAADDVDGDEVAFAITGGADQDLFQITDGTELGFVAPPNFEDPRDADDDNEYLVQVTADDGVEGGTATQDLTVTVTDVLEITSMAEAAAGDFLL